MTLGTLAARYDGRAPRYTSYPTAVQFTTAVDAEVYQTWLTALPPTQALSLYLHIPFCSRLCWFCGCNTRVINRRDSIVGYLDNLEGELAILERGLARRPRVSAVHLGGGTPNILERDDLTRLFGLLRHVFALTPNCAISAEMDPATLTQNWVRAAVFHGLNRASLGVQDLNPAVQAAVNRKLTCEQLAAAIGWLREGGVGSVNLDLMYGLPRQGTAEVLSTVEQVLALRPDRIALFGYAHVPWMKPHQKLIANDDLPGAAERLDQAQAAAERLSAEGYVRIGLDHFALPDDELAKAVVTGSLRRNFQGYTADPATPLLGLGPSAIGSLPQGYLQNFTSEVEWRRAIAQGRLPVARGVALTHEDRARAGVIERLMCGLRVDLRDIDPAIPDLTDILMGEAADLAGMAADGLVVVQGSVVQITEAGRPFVRSACAAFDAYLAAGRDRHAAAV